MLKISNDAEAVYLIRRVLSGDYETEEEVDLLEEVLEEYQTGLGDVLILENDLTPEEILALARERNRPIIL